MLRILKDTAAGFSNDECSKTAAALAYYTLFSLPALMVIIIAVLGLAFSADTVETALREQIQGLIGGGAANQVLEMVQKASASPGSGALATILGVVFLVIGATGVVAQLQDALNDAWDVEPDPERGGVWNYIRKRILSFAMILGIAFLLLVSLFLTTFLAAAGNYVGGLLPATTSKVLLPVINFLFSFAVLTLLFAAMFKFLPDAKLRWGNVWLGGAITALLFSIGKDLIGWYLGSSDVASGFGAAGSLVLVLIWVYYSAMIFFVGAEFTKAWTKAHGEEIEPAEGAVRLVDKKEIVKPRRQPAAS